MAFFALIIAVILIVAAVRNSQGALFSAVGEDAPKFIVWFAAIVAIGVIGFIPGLKATSRLLLALVVVVLVVNNYQKFLAGFTNAWTHPGANGSGKVTTPSGGSASGQATGNANATTNPQSATTSGPQSWSDLIDPNLSSVYQ